MDSDIVISVEGVSKAYRIYESPSRRLEVPLLQAAAQLLPRDSRLARAFQARATNSYRDFWALKPISLQLRKGEALGILGRNGSGKSTLLQMIAGTLQPTTGSVAVNGRLAALLELGSGFNPDFTGRENVYLNGTVLGMSRAEIEARFDEIAAFADIGDFIEQPTSTYSSGMLVRLAFAVAVCVRPDILVVDEALSVGDVFFQQKCFQRIRDILEAGTSLIFVSHDTASVQNLCDRAILLVKGVEAYSGPPEEAASRYYATSAPRNGAHSGSGVQHAASPERGAIERLIEEHDIARQAKARHGAGELMVEKVAVLDRRNQPSMSFDVGEEMVIALRLRAGREIAGPSSGMHLFDRMNNIIFAAGTRQLKVPFGDFAADESRIVIFRIELAVQPGKYTFSVGCAQASDDGPNAGYIQDRLEGLGPITVVATDGTWPFYGMARLPMIIDVYG